MTYEVRNEEVEQVLRRLGRELKEEMPPGFGFTLMIFSYEEHEGAMFYLSSASRNDMVKAMREFIAKFEEN
jgi:hypothetical protein